MQLFNLLNIAMGVCGSITAQYLAFNGYEFNELGERVGSYAKPRFIRGNLQPISQTMYSELGLDFSQSYYTFYTLENLSFISTECSSDRISADGVLYQVMSRDDWFSYNGWVGVTCVRI